MDTTYNTFDAITEEAVKLTQDEAPLNLNDFCKMAKKKPSKTHCIYTYSLYINASH